MMRSMHYDCTLPNNSLSDKSISKQSIKWFMPIQNKFPWGVIIWDSLMLRKRIGELTKPANLTLMKKLFFLK